jgi:hypothetical protein
MFALCTLPHNRKAVGRSNYAVPRAVALNRRADFRANPGADGSEWKLESPGETLMPMPWVRRPVVTSASLQRLVDVPCFRAVEYVEQLI